jgi:hypothetical protein
MAEELDMRLVKLLVEGGVLTLDQAAARLPETGWNELFVTLDRLSRSGKIWLHREGFEYLLAAASVSAAHNKGMEGLGTDSLISLLKDSPEVP